LAESDNQSIANFIENAALRFVEEKEFLDDFKMRKYYPTRN